MLPLPDASKVKRVSKKKKRNTSKSGADANGKRGVEGKGGIPDEKRAKASGVSCSNSSQLQTDMLQNGYCCLRMSPEYQERFRDLSLGGDEQLLSQLVDKKSTSMNHTLQPKDSFGKVLRCVYTS